MSSVSSDYESSYYTESEAESDYVTHEDGQQTHHNHTLEVEDIIREHVNVTTKNAIGLNHHYKTKLLMLRMQLEGLLARCQNRLIEVEKGLDDLRQNLAPKPRPARPRYPGYICGQPFFKDHELYPGPHNEDYLYRKNVKKEFFPLDLFESTESLWTHKDKHKLTSSIQTQAQEFLQRENELREKICNNSESAARIRKERMELSTLPIEEIWHKAQSYDGQYGRQKFTVDWLQISTSVMCGRHSAAACEGMWNNYLKPGFKRAMWTQEEETKLVEAAESHKFHNWDRIADRVGQRSEYQCFVHYQTNFSELVQSKKMPWTREEDELLLRLVDENRIGNNVIWNKIVERMPYRNKVQVYHRYKYTLLRPLRGAKFTEEEDCVITAYVQQYGDDFKFFPDDMLPGRTTKQVWARYKNTLRFVNRHVGWSLGEDKRLMSYIAEHLTEEGPQKISWAHCSKYLGNHSRLSCRTRYYTIERFLEKNPEATLDDVPRREKKKLSTKVTDKNWIETIFDIKSAPKSGARKTGSGPINLFQTGKPTTAEWSLYEQMKFCFRYKFGNRLAVDTTQSHILTGTKMLLHLLEAFHEDSMNKAMLPCSAQRQLNANDKAALNAVLRSPLDWPTVVSIMRPKITVSGDAMLFCRIPPNYNTVLGLRGVCLNACSTSEQTETKQMLPELKVKKIGKLDEAMYDQAMTAFVERFRKIFHWTMLLMMLNIDDVTLENDEPLGNFPANTSISNPMLGQMVNSALAASSTAKKTAKPEIQLKPLQNLICPVKTDKLMHVPCGVETYPEQAATSSSFVAPIARESMESNLKLVTNITIIDPKDLPAVTEHENRGEVISDHRQSLVDHYQQRADNRFPLLEEQAQAPAENKTTNKRKPREKKASNARISTKKEKPRNNKNRNTEQNVNLLAIPESELTSDVTPDQQTLLDQYQLFGPSKTEIQTPTTSKTTSKRKPRKTKAASRPRKSTKNLAPCVDGQHENGVGQIATVLEPSSTNSNHNVAHNVTTFTIMEVPQTMYLMHQQQQQQLSLDYVAAHVPCVQETPAQCIGDLGGHHSNSIYGEQTIQNMAKACDELQPATAVQCSTEYCTPPTTMMANLSDNPSPSGSNTNVLEMLANPVEGTSAGNSFPEVTEVPCRPVPVACDDMVIVDKNHYLPDIGAMTIISNTRDGNQELERLIVTEREIQVPSGQIAFEGNFISYCFTDEHNPETQEMLAAYKDKHTPLENTAAVPCESVSWHQTLNSSEDDAKTVVKDSEEPNAAYRGEEGSTVTPTETVPKDETTETVDTKPSFNLELLNDIDGGQVTAVDIIRMLRTRHDEDDDDDEDSDEDTELEDDVPNDAAGCTG
ncbi:uncharacterized protein LOC5667697 isoform X2 [Anopheles gambiae]|uniref:uncharacterized protein LOC5667697 isoform X2 n=1 Tax=Anopheles gambiae TaxID=7165 RepID=UPI002AC99544|nr:uncharacterized protein LOC5667697 isoform X2 [Anopheles gambiae]